MMAIFSNASKKDLDRLETFVEELAADLKNARMNLKKVRADLSRLYLKHAETRQHLQIVETYLRQDASDFAVDDEPEDAAPTPVDREIERLRVAR